MLKLTANDGNEFTLEVISYQFTDLKNAGLDSNWLIVAGNVKTQRGTWSFRDPCLTAHDLRALRDWFYGMRAEQKGELDFIEPNLKFEVRDHSLYISFARESAPPWATEDEKLGDGVALQFPLDQVSVSACGDALKLMINKFPVRTPWWKFRE